jgi:hypothetical protein
MRRGKAARREVFNPAGLGGNNTPFDAARLVPAPAFKKSGYIPVFFCIICEKSLTRKKEVW